MQKIHLIALVGLSWIVGCNPRPPSTTSGSTTQTPPPKTQECVFRDDLCSSRIKTIKDGKATEFAPADVANKHQDANGQFSEIGDQLCEEVGGKLVLKASLTGLADGSYTFSKGTTSLKELCKNAGVANCQLAEDTINEASEDNLKKNTARFCKIVTK